MLVATQANFFRQSSGHRVPHFLGAGKNHTTNKFHAVFQIVQDSDLANTEVEYIDCGTATATACLSTPTVIHTMANLLNTTVNADAAVTNVKTNGVYDLEYTPSQGYNHIITKLKLNSHTILEESYLCAAGHVPRVGNVGCDQCDAGKYAAFGANSCSDCTPGKHSSARATDVSQCTACVAGKYNPTAGAVCQDCVPTSTSSQAAVGYQDQTGQVDCKQCTTPTTGSQYVSTAGVCTLSSDTSISTCSTGLSCTGTTNSCVTGDAFAGNGVDAHCSGSSGNYNCACTNGQGVGASSGCMDCQTCDTGYGLNANSCTACGAGKYNPHAGGACQDCALGHQTENATDVANSGATKCEVCVAGTTDDDSDSSTACLPCVAGKYEAGIGVDGACDNCGVGTYSNETGAYLATTCQDCNAGLTTGLTTENAGSGQATDCVFAVTMYGYVHANLTGTCQDECVEWHGELTDNFVNANEVQRLNATGTDLDLCNLLKQKGEMIKQRGC